MLKQFVLPLEKPAGCEPGDFIVAACNERALDFVQRWPDWPARSAAIFGPAGCGKSHLARIWKGRAGAGLVAAGDLKAGFNPGSALVVEDMDRVAPDLSRDRILMELFDNPGLSLLLTGRSPPAHWPFATGDWKSRLQSLIAFEIRLPDDGFLSVLIERQFAERQLHVPHSLIERILFHVERTPDAVGRFIEAADRKAWSEKRPVSLRLVSEILDQNESGMPVSGVSP